MAFLCAMNLYNCSSLYYFYNLVLVIKEISKKIVKNAYMTHRYWYLSIKDYKAFKTGEKPFLVKQGKIYNYFLEFFAFL